ncbi:ESCO1/2 acetyl-transferase-domain-containing protein [Dipodascopsis uninucleata]
MSLRPIRPTTTYQNRKRPGYASSSASLSSSGSMPSSPNTSLIESFLLSTPPSSPPPLSGKKQKRLKLQDHDLNVQTTPPKLQAPKKTQTYLSLGQTQRTTCTQCGMSYMTYSEDDVRIHKKFHSRAIEGVEVTITNSKDSLVCTRIMHDRTGCKVIHEIHAFTKLNVTKSVQRAVDAVVELCNTELSAPKERVRAWKDPNAKAYACLERRPGGKLVIIGILLAERTKEGFFMSATTGRLVKHNGIDEKINLIMGISRIYVVHKSRRRGVAAAILDSACQDFIYGLNVPRNMVGWSQPSDSGCKLALQWFSEDMTDDEIASDIGDKSSCLVEPTGRRKKINVYIEPSSLS